MSIECEKKLRNNTHIHVIQEFAKYNIYIYINIYKFINASLQNIQYVYRNKIKNIIINIINSQRSIMKEKKTKIDDLSTA